MHASGAVQVTPLSALPLAPGTRGAAPSVQRDPFHHSTSGTGEFPATEYPTARHQLGDTQSTDTRSAAGVCAGSIVGVTRHAFPRDTSAGDRYVARVVRCGPTVTHTF